MIKKPLVLVGIGLLLLALPVVGVWTFFNKVNYASSNKGMEITAEQKQALEEGYPSDIDTRYDSTNKDPLNLHNTEAEAKPSFKPQSNTNTEKPAPYKPLEVSQADKDTMARVEAELAQQRENVRLMKCENIVSSNALDIEGEERRHNTAIENIDLDHRRRGTYYSGIRQADINSEDSLHQYNMNVISTQSQGKLIQGDCI